MAKRRKRAARSSPVVVNPDTGGKTLTTELLINATGVWPYRDATHKAILESLGTDSDRSAAIVASSIIDVRLEAALRHRLRPDADVLNDLFAPDGPLGSFRAKIDIAYAVGIIGKEAWDDLAIIRAVRNAFAHDLTILNFASPSIKDRVGNLRMIETYAVSTILDKPDQLFFNTSNNARPRLGIVDLDTRKHDPRTRYLIACSIIVSALYHCELRTEGQLT